MSISSMGVRSALRAAQEAQPASAPSGVVVSAVQPPGDGEEPAANPRDSGDPLSEFLERLTAWIPTESIAVFLSFGGFFNVFEDTTQEAVLVVVVSILTVGYAVQASRGAQIRRSQEPKFSTSATTAALALIAFLVWWVATPGTWLTADEGVDSFYVACLLVLVVAILPWAATKLKVEPLRA